MVDILDLSAPDDPEHAAVFHFHVLAKDNAAAAARVDAVLPPEPVSLPGGVAG